MSIVTTPLGLLKGTEYTTDRGEVIYCYQGVPYGKPPTGELRFKDPVPIEPWEGVRSAENAPPQAAALYWDEKLSSALVPGSSEDCLYLNVYTPKGTSAGDNLPVFTFIHGGGFTFGSGNMSFVGPDYIVPAGVILVTINYRLGVLGFLSFENTECSGNYGLKDQNLALKWIQQNISAFGGDPGNVTLAGESAGAASVHYQTLSPLSKGLFHRVIVMSAAAINRFAYSRFASKSAFLLAKKLGYDGNDSAEALKILRDASVEELVLNTVGLFEEIEGKWSCEHIMGFPFVPTAEPVETPNAFITKHPSEAVKDGDLIDVPYLTGICEKEAIFCMPGPDYVPDWEDDEEFQKMLPKEFNLPLGCEKLKVASQKLRSFYFPDGKSTQEGFLRSMSTLTFCYGIRKMVEAYAKNPKKTAPNYLYLFTAEPKPSVCKDIFGVGSVEGCTHADDLQYLFLGTFHPAVPAIPIVPGSYDDEVMQNVIRLYTEFCKTGKISDWPPATPENDWSYMKIDKDLEVRQGLISDEVEFWDDLYQFLQS